MYRFGITLILISLATAPRADLLVAFTEGAPKDSFSIVNQGACALKQKALLIDLGGSAAGLIFDVTGAGAGEQVFQPLEFVLGRENLLDAPHVSDGDTRILLRIKDLAPGAEIRFTIDVDDTLGERGTIVSGAEIEGARVVILDSDAEASFGANARARVLYDSCAA